MVSTTIGGDDGNDALMIVTAVASPFRLWIFNDDLLTIWIR
jgi:hypothetical protein